MKLGISETMKRVLTVAEMPAVNVVKETFRNTLKEQKNFDWEAKQAVYIATRHSGLEILKVSAEIAKNKRAWNYYSGDESDKPSWDIDIELTVYAYDYFYGFYEVHAMLSDIWSTGSHNEDEMRGHMWYRHYALEK